MGEQPSTEMDKQEHNETSRVANAIQIVSFCEPNFFLREARLLPAALLPGYMAVIFVDSKSLKPLDRHS